MAIKNYSSILTVDTFSDLSSIPSPADGQIGYVDDTRLVYTYSATLATWQPSNRLVVKRSMVTINGKVAGSTPIYTLETVGTMNFFPTQVVPRVISITGAGIIAPTVSVGTNSPNYNNIATANPINSILATLNSGSGAPQPATYSPSLTAGTVIYANVVGAAFTTGNYQVRYDIVGYYEN